MAFRSDREALEAKVRSLESESEQLREKLAETVVGAANDDRLEAKIRGLEADNEQVRDRLQLAQLRNDQRVQELVDARKQLAGGAAPSAFNRNVAVIVGGVVVLFVLLWSTAAAIGAP